MQTAQGLLHLPSVIEFNCTTEPLALELSEAKTYTTGNLPNLIADVDLLNNASLWHMIIVHKGNATKHEILRALNNLVGQEFFVPIAYRNVNASIDIFFLQNQTKALEKFFTSRLLVNDGGRQFSLSVQLGVCKWRNRHPKIVNKIHAAVENRIQTMDKVNNVLDFNCFGSSLVLAADFEVSLRNKAVFNIVMDQLSNQERLKKKELKTNFSGNDINNLEPFTKLHDYKIKSIDLRNNDITDVQHFHYLKHLNIESIEIDGNEKLFKTLNYAERIFSIMPSLKTLDHKCRTRNIQIPIQEIVQSTKPSIPVDLGIGNENIVISTMSKSIPIMCHSNRKEQFGHLRDSFNSYRDEATWTKVIIHASDLSKDAVLDALLAQIVDNCVFFPCYYQYTPNQHEFFLYRNFDALKCMMHKDLEIVHGNRKIRIELILRAATFQPGQVNWVYKIRSVLSNRIEATTLNLDNFVNDPDFSKLSVLLNSDCNMNFVLEQAKKICPNLTTLSAQNNKLKNVKGFKNLNQQFPSLYKLDLSFNEIVSLDDLVAPIAKVKELLLDSNPICSMYQAAHAYVEHAQIFFIDMETLDRSKIETLTRVPSLQNFIISNKAYNLVDEFTKTFFSLYDSDRHRLKDLYSSSSIFSISVFYDPSIMDNKSNNLASIFSRIQAYLNNSRFLQKIANMNQVFHNIFTGQDSITDVMNRLPRTKHLMTSFNVDVPFYNPESVTIIKISGVFEDYGKSLTDKSNLFLGFSRNFVLRLVENEVQISNDQLFIYNTKLDDLTGNFISEVEHEISVDESEDKQVKLILFMELTNLKQDEALKLLQKTFFNFKMALGIFKTLMESNSYSENAFDFEN